MAIPEKPSSAVFRRVRFGDDAKNEAIYEINRAFTCMEELIWPAHKPMLRFPCPSYGIAA
jgi:hypothetical protein